MLEAGDREAADCEARSHTDLPEGAEVELMVVDDEDFDPEDRARLLEAIEEGFADFERGDPMDGSEFIARSRAGREAASR